MSAFDRMYECPECKQRFESRYCNNEACSYRGEIGMDDERAVATAKLPTGTDLLKQAEGRVKHWEGCLQASRDIRSDAAEALKLADSDVARTLDNLYRARTVVDGVRSLLARHEQ